MRLIEEKTTKDDYSILLVEGDERFGVVLGCTVEELCDPEIDIEPEWFDTIEEATKYRNKEFEFFNQ